MRVDAYIQWAYVATCLFSLLFVIGYTFTSATSRFPFVHWQFAAWWHHRIGLSQVAWDLGLFVLLLPITMYVITGVDVLRLVSGSVASMWYSRIGLTYVAVTTIWRTIAVMESKAEIAQDLRRRRARKEGRDEPDLPPADEP